MLELIYPLAAIRTAAAVDIHGKDLIKGPHASALLQSRKLRRFLPCYAAPDRVEIRLHFRESAIAEARLFDHVENGPIRTIDQTEVVAQHPLALRELPLEDLEHGRQRFLAACDRRFVAGKSDDLHRDTLECEIPRRRRDMPRQKIKPSRRIGASARRRRP